MPIILNMKQCLKWIGGQYNPKRFDRKIDQSHLSSVAKRNHWVIPKVHVSPQFGGGKDGLLPKIPKHCVVCWAA